MMLRDLTPLTLFTFPHGNKRRMYVAVVQCPYIKAAQAAYTTAECIFYLDLSCGELFSTHGDAEVEVVT